MLAKLWSRLNKNFIMKKILLICLFLLVIYLCLIINVIPANAAFKFIEGLTATGNKAFGTALTIQKYAANLVRAFLMLIGIIFVALLIYGGFLYLTSAGSEDKVKKAKNSLKAAVIGLVIIFSGYTITFFITASLETPGSAPASNCTTQCLDTYSSSYYSINCCENRFSCSGGQVDVSCCSQTVFCRAHRDACATQVDVSSMCP